MSSSEAVTFQGEYSNLVRVTSSNPALLAHKLWSCAIIGEQARKDAEVTTISPYDRATKLLSAVGDQIKTAPKEKFVKFVDVLKNEPSWRHLAVRLDPRIDPGTNSVANTVQQSTSSSTQTGFQDTFSPNEVVQWFKNLGLVERDITLLVDDGFGTAGGYRHLTAEDVAEMAFTRAGRGILKKNLIAGSPPPNIAMDCHSAGGPPAPYSTIPHGAGGPPAPYSMAPHGAGGPPASFSHGAGGPPPPIFSPPPPTEPRTPAEIAEGIGLEPYLLDQEFPDNFTTYLAFSKLIPNWEQFASSLGLSEQVKHGILTNLNLSYSMKATEVLKRWKSRYGFKGTYRVLIEACLRQDDVGLATKMCHLIRSLCGPSYSSSYNTRRSSPPISPDKMVDMAPTIGNILHALKPIPLTRSSNGVLGRALKVPEYRISEFQANNPHDIYQVRTEIINHWTRNEPSEWSGIANAVAKMGEKNLARKLRTYRTPDDSMSD